MGDAETSLDQIAAREIGWVHPLMLALSGIGGQKGIAASLPLPPPPHSVVLTHPIVTAVYPPVAHALRDRYALERELGSGGVATVNLVQDLKHPR